MRYRQFETGGGSREIRFEFLHVFGGETAIICSKYARMNNRRLKGKPVTVEGVSILTIRFRNSP